MEEAVTFKNRAGKQLIGIVHIPEGVSCQGRKIGVNILNPGIKYRVAPNRLNVKLARELCRKGYYVLRFDPGGVGDSEGELPEDILIADIWEKIQKGLFVDDTIASNTFFVDKCGIDELVLIGNCGGAITALLTSSKDPRVRGLCLIDIPVNLRDSRMTFAEKISERGEKADQFHSEYIKKIFSLKSWVRFFTFQTNYKALWKIIRIRTSKKLNLICPFFSQYTSPNNLATLCLEKKLNNLFFESFESCIKDNKHILFILAGNDSGTEIFQHYFQDIYLNDFCQNSNYEDLIEIFLIKDANHIYGLCECQELLINKVLKWFKAQRTYVI